MKALHPSDHEIKSTRVPGGNHMSVALCSDQIETIPITNAGATASITLIPNPLIPCVVDVIDGGTTTYKHFINAAFGGTVRTNTTWSNIFNQSQSFAKRVEKYRVTSQSVTVELIAPALADQGTITACQYDVPPRTVNPSYCDITSPNDFNTGRTVYCTPDFYVYEKPVTTSQMVLGTQAYTAKAREGAYMPLKLRSFKWRNNNDPMVAYATTAELGRVMCTSATPMDSSGWPFYLGALPSTDQFGVAGLLPKNCGHGIGVMAIEGMAASVAIRVRVRQTLEIVCKPSTEFSPMAEVALPPDDTALRMYYEVSSRMADAYPASYNDLGKLKSIISGLAKKILPFVDPALDFLSGIPGPVGAIATGAKTVIPVVKQVREAVKKKKMAKK